MILGAVDKQFATLEPDPAGTFLILGLRLPAQPGPTNRTQWVTTQILLPIPHHLRTRVIIRWHPPTITVQPTKLGIARFRLA